MPCGPTGLAGGLPLPLLLRLLDEQELLQQQIPLYQRCLQATAYRPVSASLRVGAHRSGRPMSR